MINTKSIAFRNAIVYLILFLVGIGIVGLLMFRYSAKAILANAEKDIVHRSELVEVKINEFVNAISSDISYLAISPVLSEYIGLPTEHNFSLLTQDYLSLIENRTSYSQIRFIGIENNGQEIARVNRVDNRCFITEKESLQAKGDRSYFTEALLLSPSEIYYSHINLNREFGKISIPHMPTLRVAKSVYKDGEKQGVIVLNTNLNKFFASLSNLVGDKYSLRMVNNEGYYILHESVDSTFVFDINESVVKPQFDVDVNSRSGLYVLIDNNKELLVSNQLEFASQYQLTQIVVGEKSFLLASYDRWRNYSWMIIIVASLIFSLLAFFFLNKQAKHLEEITRGMLNYPSNRNIGDLPINRDDEIGHLARGFNEMAIIINNQINTVEAAKDKAEIANREKSEFIENMSHEIRNPLQSIMGLNSMLESNNPTASQLKLIHSLSFNTANLNSLVNIFLDFQNVVKGEIKLDYKWSNIHNLVSEIVNSNVYAAVTKSIEFKSEVSEVIRLNEYKIDRLRLSQILNNLVSNAIKYTEENGFVLVSLIEFGKNESDSVLRFSVKDNGVGLSDKEMQNFKERYFIGETKAVSSSYGLGLTIVNELLSFSNSQLQVESVRGEGSTFYFDLEVGRRAVRDSLPNTSVSDFQLPSINILVIEDDAQILELYNHFFANTKANVNYCTEVPYSKSTGSYDFVISDYRLGNTNLTEERNKLLGHIGSETPIVIVSAIVPNADALSSTFDKLYFLSKPFEITELQNVIFKVLTLSKFNTPIFENIKKDYDYDITKYKRAIKLLYDGWLSMYESIISAMYDSDVESYQTVLHKLITSLKRLELEGLEKHLAGIQSQLERECEIEDLMIEEVEKILQLYLHLIEEEL